MHSRIFQVSENPVTNDNFIDEERYDENFINSIADYVDLIEYKSDGYYNDLKYLLNSTEGISVDIKQGVIKVTSKEQYFLRKYERFKELALKLSEITLEEFASHKQWFNMFELSEAYNNAHSFYMDDGNEAMTIDDWVRYAELNKAYYVGNIFDYHF